MIVKFCGIRSAEDIQTAVSAGANTLGFNCVDPPSARSIPFKTAASLIGNVPPQIRTTLITSASFSSALLDAIAESGASMLQSVAPLSPSEWSQIKLYFPHLERIQVVHVTDRSVLDAITIYHGAIDYFLLDTADVRNGKTLLGGVGKTHDWTISAEFRDTAKTPVILAGGLNSQNVATAIKTVRPVGIDLCSALRTDNALDLQKCNNFMNAVLTAQKISIDTALSPTDV